MDIKAIVEKVVATLKAKPDLLAKFKKSPLDTVKSLVTEKLNGDQLKEVVEKVTAKLGAGAAADAASSALGKLFK